MLQSITWDYLAGLIETDGTFKISLNKTGNLKPIFTISQKENTGLLKKIKIFLLKEDINSTLDIYNSLKTNRAPQLRVQGRLQVLRFCELLEKNCNGFIFCSQKYRDLLIMKATLSTKNLDVSEKIDLMLNLHKTKTSQLDLTCYTTKLSRKKHEQRLGLDLGSSDNAAKVILQSIDKKFTMHQKIIRDKLISNSMRLNSDWCVGIFDGDGFFAVALNVDHSNKKIRYIPMFGLTMEKAAKLTLFVFNHMVHCDGKIIVHKDKNANITAMRLSVTRKEYLKKLVEFFEIYEPRNSVKKKQVNLIRLFFDMEKRGGFDDKNQVISFIKQCYSVTELGKGKGKRKYTLDEALKKVNDWLID